MPGPWMIACCGCGRILKHDGTTGEAVIATGGTIDLESLTRRYLNGDDTFPTKQEADAIAAAAGWQTFDSDGPNHRCPECVKKMESRSGHRGAYIDLSAT